MSLISMRAEWIESEGEGEVRSSVRAGWFCSAGVQEPANKEGAELN